MGTVALECEADVQQFLVQVNHFTRKNSWYRLTLNEVDTQLGHLYKTTIGDMNLDELLKNVWNPETNQSVRMEANNGSSAPSIKRRGSIGLSGNLSGKISDEMWKDIQLREKMKGSEVVKREPSTSEMTLEDFLTKAGAMDDESSMSPGLPFDVSGSTPQCFSQHMGLSPAPSIGALSDTPVVGRKRDNPGTMDRGIEKKMKRKIKNRESAARSRARKQAYHNELVNKVSHLEEQNMRLKKEKDLEDHCSNDLSEPRYQLRRTSSWAF